MSFCFLFCLCSTEIMPGGSSGLSMRRRSKGITGRDRERDRGGPDRQRSFQRGMDGGMHETLDGVFGMEKAGAGEKQLIHLEWTKDPLPDDFDDEDLS
ncbi:unnamed protein product [Discosporangium mesarthrocarpum]